MSENKEESGRMWDWLFFWNLFKQPMIIPDDSVYNEQQQEQEPTEMHDEECCQTRNEPCGCVEVLPPEPTE